MLYVLNQQPKKTLNANDESLCLFDTISSSFGNNRRIWHLDEFPHRLPGFTGPDSSTALDKAIKFNRPYYTTYFSLCQQLFLYFTIRFNIDKTVRYTLMIYA